MTVLDATEARSRLHSLISDELRWRWTCRRNGGGDRMGGGQFNRCSFVISTSRESQ